MEVPGTNITGGIRLVRMRQDRLLMRLRLWLGHLCRIHRNDHGMLIFLVLVLYLAPFSFPHTYLSLSRPRDRRSAVSRRLLQHSLLRPTKKLHLSSTLHSAVVLTLHSTTAAFFPPAAILAHPHLTRFPS